MYLHGSVLLWLYAYREPPPMSFTVSKHVAGLQHKKKSLIEDNLFIHMHSITTKEMFYKSGLTLSGISNSPMARQ
ncbi:hypothetical protein VNO78_15394 [Psophocarpus tetragonolobus]|uniref:Uncharacterized protein n=1 Tax=Psophocarpus tetragonolobus TaxID=3891 RepID=A0AAN9SIP6_PSOTE